MWSVGCILAELLKRKPFLPGTESKRKFVYNLKNLAKTQLELIIDVFGNPKPEEIKTIQKEKSRKFIQSLPKKQPKPLDVLFPRANPLGFYIILIL